MGSCLGIIGLDGYGEWTQETTMRFGVDSKRGGKVCEHAAHAYMQKNDQKGVVFQDVHKNILFL